jgi:nitroimidazol reductase NimA-like FMN-containing flavoprotein (pyridoxamine 5'-phosphate oxidase superfamily)
MSTFHSPTDLIELSQDECLQLLASRRVGRLAFVVDGQPTILPVNYAVDGQAIVFRTDQGAKLTHVPMTRVAFEVDDVDENLAEGWDVVVEGFADDITDSIDERSEALRHLPLTTFAPGARWHWLRVSATKITGRRLLSR